MLSWHWHLGILEVVVGTVLVHNYEMKNNIITLFVVPKAMTDVTISVTARIDRSKPKIFFQMVIRYILECT